jgi:RPA family protein
MADFKRHIAFKHKIGDILAGKPIMDGDKFQFLELGNKQISRVNIIGNIVDKYISEGEKKYAFFTLDDASGQIKLKIFGDDLEKFKNINQGETVLVIGVLRNWNNETYIQPEIIKPQEPKYLLVRKLELEKKQAESTPPAREEVIAIKDKILEKIKSAEEQGGIEIDSIILELKESSPAYIFQKIPKNLLLLKNNQNR